MTESIAIFASINFTVVGLSHICQVQAWRDFFQKLHSMGEAGAFANGMITLFMGSLIVSFHNVWTGVPVILTLIGWGYILKSTAIFVYPQWNLRSMKNVENKPKLKLRIAGTALLGVALTILLSIAFGQYS
jgi:uncharacterized protein YjeT (DUF2065 family)